MSQLKFLSIFIASFALSVAFPCYALLGCSGVYLGGQLGYAHNEYNMEAFFDRDYSNNETCGRVYLGYQFTPFLGLESGVSMINVAQLPDDFGQVATGNLDLLLRVGMPITGTGLRVDLKGGAAYVVADFDATDVAKYYQFGDKKKGEFKPVLGASLSYDFCYFFAIDFSYLHFYDDPQRSTLNTPCIDMAMLGLRVLFTVI